MQGSTLQAMAEAVENSVVVLICMSERYKQSPNCRTEAEYTFTLRKEFIPLMLQRGYRPDGWLGILLGAKLFYDFSGKYPHDKKMQELLRVLSESAMDAHNTPKGSKARQKNKTIDNEIKKENAETALAVVQHQPPVAAAAAAEAKPVDYASRVKSSVSETASVNLECVKMSKDDVKEWLLSNGMQRVIGQFLDFDGKLIWQLKKMRDADPQYYHLRLKRHFKMKLMEMLQFNAALDEFS